MRVGIYLLADCCIISLSSSSQELSSIFGSFPSHICSYRLLDTFHRSSCSSLGMNNPIVRNKLLIMFYLRRIHHYRKNLWCNPQNDKKFHNFQMGVTTKAIKISIVDENLFAFILNYSNKNIHFQWITKKCKSYKMKFSLK